jgi:hypothetical protein
MTTSVSVPQGTATLALLSASEAAAIPGRRDADDRWAWWFTPEHALVSSARHHRQRVEVVGGPRALLLLEPDAESAGLYTLEREPTSRDDTRPLPTSPDWSIRVRVSARHHVHARADITLAERNNVAQWLCWPSGPPTTDQWSAAFELFRVYVDEMRERALRDGVASLPADRLSVYLRLFGLRATPSGAWTHVADPTKTLHADGLPAASIIATSRSFHQLETVLTRREVLTALADVAPNLLRVIPAHGPWIAIDSPGVWVAEDSEGTTLAVHEIHPIVTPSLLLHHHRHNTVDGTWTISEQLSYTSIHVDQLTGRADYATVAISVKPAPPSTTTRWYTVPFRLDTASSSIDTRLHAAIEAFVLRVDERALRTPVHAGDTPFTFDAERASTSGFVSTTLLDGAFACVAVLAFTEQDTPSGVMSLAETAVIPKYTPPTALTPLDLDRAMCAPRAHYAAVIPPASRFPARPSSLFPAFRWRRLAGVTFVVFSTAAPPPLRAPLSSPPFSAAALASHREALRRELASHAGREATSPWHGDDAASPRTDGAQTLLSVVARTYASRRHAQLVLAWFAARRRISYAAALARMQHMSVEELADECDLHRMLGTLDAVFLAPPPVSAALPIATERLECVPVFDPRGDGLSDAFVWLLSWDLNRREDTPTMERFRQMLSAATSAVVYPPMAFFDQVASSDAVMARWIAERDEIAARVARERAERSLPEWLTRRRPALAVLDRPLAPLLREIADDDETAPADRRVCAHVLSTLGVYRSAYVTTTPKVFTDVEFIVEHATLRDLQLTRVSAALRERGDERVAAVIERFARLPVQLFPHHYTAGDMWRVVPIGGADSDAVELAAETFYHDEPPSPTSDYTRLRAALAHDPNAERDANAVDRVRALRDIALRRRVSAVRNDSHQVQALYMTDALSTRVRALEEYRANAEDRWVRIQEGRVAAWYSRANQRNGCHVRDATPPTVEEFFTALPRVPFPPSPLRSLLAEREHYLEQARPLDAMVRALHTRTDISPSAEVDSYRRARARSRDTLGDWRDTEADEDAELYRAAFGTEYATVVHVKQRLEAARKLAVATKHALLVAYGRYLLCFVHHDLERIEAAAREVKERIRALVSETVELVRLDEATEAAMVALQRRVDAASPDYARVMAAWTPAFAATLYRELTGGDARMPDGWSDQRVRNLARDTIVHPLGEKSPAAAIREVVRAGALTATTAPAGAPIAPGSSAAAANEQRSLDALLALHSVYRTYGFDQHAAVVAKAVGAVTDGAYRRLFLEMVTPPLSGEVALAIIGAEQPLPAEEQLYDRFVHAAIGARLAGIPFGVETSAYTRDALRTSFNAEFVRAMNSRWSQAISAVQRADEWHDAMHAAVIRTWEDAMSTVLQPYRRVIAACLYAVSKTPAAERIGFPDTIELSQQRFFRPSPRESSGVVAALNTVFAADPENRDATALPRVVWKQRLEELERRRATEAIAPRATMPGLWSVDERTRVVVSRKTDTDVARAAIRWAIRDFYTHEVASSAVVPAAAFELLLWTLLSDIAFLELRRRYSFDGESTRSPFSRLVTHWQLPSGTGYMVVDHRQATALLDAVTAESPRALDALGALAEKNYRLSRREVSQLWRLVLFGRANAPSVLVIAGGNSTFPITIREAYELSQFIVDFDTALFAAVKRITDEAAHKALDAADRTLLAHITFTFLLGYVAPRDPRAALFVQVQHPDGTVLFDHFHGQAVREIAVHAFGIAAAARPIGLEWYEEFERLVSGLLYAPTGAVLHGGSPLVDEFVTYVLAPYVRERTTRRRLVRWERAVAPFDLDVDLLHGTAVALVANTAVPPFASARPLENEEEYDPATGTMVPAKEPPPIARLPVAPEMLDRVFRMVSPLQRISGRATIAYPEGEDTAYSADETDFTPDPAFSYYEWRRGRVCFLRPSKARDDQTQSVDFDNAVSETQFLASMVMRDDAGDKRWRLAREGFFPELLLVPQTPVLRWFESWRRYGYARRPRAEEIQTATLVDQDVFDGAPLPPPINRAQMVALYGALQLELTTTFAKHSATWETVLAPFDSPPRDTYTALEAELRAQLTAVSEEALSERTYIAYRARVAHFCRGVELYSTYAERVRSAIDEFLLT